MSSSSSRRSPVSGTALEPVLSMVRIDFDPPEAQPSWIRWAIASVVAVVGSLVADALLVAVAVKLFPHLKQYPHFQFSDYSKLTVIGVVFAAIGWPIVTRVSSSPRWLYLVSAVVVTLVLLLPDVYIWYLGQKPKAVATLMVMHVAIAVVTYCSMVFIAPCGPDRSPARA